MTPAIHVGVDVDQVLSDFCVGFIGRANRVLGLHIPSDHVWAHWDISVSLGISKEDEKRVWEDILAGDDFNKDLPQCKFSQGLTSYLSGLVDERMIRVTFITARTEHAPGFDTVQQQTCQWLERHGFRHPTVIVSFDKGVIAKALKLTDFIDDKFANCLEVREACPGARIYMPVWSFNKQYIADAIANDIMPVETPFEAIDRILLKEPVAA